MNIIKHKRSTIITLIIAALFLVLFLYLSSISHKLLWDETVYLSNAKAHISQSNFTEDFRYPMLSWTISFLWMFTGESILAAKIFCILLTVLTIVLFYWISKRYLSMPLDLIATILFGTSPLILFWGFRIYTDIPSLFFMLLSYYLIIRVSELKSDNKKSKKIKSKTEKYEVLLMILSGIFSAIAFLMRFPQGLFIACIILFLLYKREIKRIIYYVIGIIIALLPWLINNYIVHKNIIWDLIAQYSVVNEWTDWEPASKQLVNLFTNNSPFIIALMVIGLCIIAYTGFFSHSIKQKRYLFYEFILGYIIIGFLTYLFLIRLKDARYYITLLPFIYILAFIPLEQLGYANKISIKKNKFQKRIIIKTVYVLVLFAVILSCAIISLSYYRIIYENHLCENDSMMQSIEYLKNQDVTGVIASNSWTWYGYYLNAKVSSLWDVKTVIDYYSPQYILYIQDESSIKQQMDNDIRYVLNKTFIGECKDKTYLYQRI